VGLDFDLLGGGRRDSAATSVVFLAGALRFSLSQRAATTTSEAMTIARLTLRNRLPLLLVGGRERTMMGCWAA
jgi:hypothetical protein